MFLSKKWPHTGFSKWFSDCAQGKLETHILGCFRPGLSQLSTLGLCYLGVELS